MLKMTALCKNSEGSLVTIQEERFMKILLSGGAALHSKTFMLFIKVRLRFAWR
jgi:hypothetical protein